MILLSKSEAAEAVPADYEKYCPRCTHFLTAEIEYPCDICMDTLEVPYSNCGIPINFEEKEK